MLAISLNVTEKKRYGEVATIETTQQTYWILDITSTVSVPGPLRRISFIQQSNIFGLDYYLLISNGITPVCMLVDISGTKSWVSS